MIQRRLISILLFLLYLATAQAEPPKGYPFMGYNEGLQLAQQQHKRIFLYFGRYGCGYCGKTNVETFSDAGLRKRYTKNYILVYVDAESGRRITLPSGERITEMELGARLNIYGTPLFLYMEANGDPILRAPGYKTVADFVNMDRYVQGNFYHKQSINEFLQADKPKP